MTHTNAHRGEISAVIAGQHLVLRLTLGALAEVESALDCDILALAGRLESGLLRTRDVIVIITAAARAGGASLSEDDIAADGVEGGPAAAFRLVADLFTAAFAPVRHP